MPYSTKPGQAAGNTSILCRVLRTAFALHKVWKVDGTAEKWTRTANQQYLCRQFVPPNRWGPRRDGEPCSREAVFPVDLQQGFSDAGEEIDDLAAAVHHLAVLPPGERRSLHHLDLRPPDQGIIDYCGGVSVVK